MYKTLDKKTKIDIRRGKKLKLFPRNGIEKGRKLIMSGLERSAIHKNLWAETCGISPRVLNIEIKIGIWIKAINAGYIL